MILHGVGHRWRGLGWRSYLLAEVTMACTRLTPVATSSRGGMGPRPLEQGRKQLLRHLLRRGIYHHEKPGSVGILKGFFHIATTRSMAADLFQSSHCGCHQLPWIRKHRNAYLQWERPHTVAGVMVGQHVVMCRQLIFPGACAQIICCPSPLTFHIPREKGQSLGRVVWKVVGISLILWIKGYSKGQSKTIIVARPTRSVTVNIVFLLRNRETIYIILHSLQR